MLPKDALVCLVKNGEIMNKDCGEYPNSTQLLTYVCEARPFNTKEGKACHFPFKVNATSKLYHSCVYDFVEGKKKVWCATKVDENGIMVSDF